MRARCGGATRGAEGQGLRWEAALTLPLPLAPRSAHVLSPPGHPMLRRTAGATKVPRGQGASCPSPLRDLGPFGWPTLMPSGAGQVGPMPAGRK